MANAARIYAQGDRVALTKKRSQVGTVVEWRIQGQKRLYRVEWDTGGAGWYWVTEVRDVA